MDKIKIVAAILDTDRLILYKADGETVEIPQGDPRIQKIIDLVTGPLTTHGEAEIDLEMTDQEANNYREFEEQASGVKFFRVAKKWLKNVFFGEGIHENDDGSYGRHQYVQPVSLGTVPVATVTSVVAPIPTAAPTAQDVTDATSAVRPDLKEATKQIMANAKPVSDPDFSSKKTREEDTMIAEVTHPTTGEKQIVPGMENLQAQFRNASKLGSTGGVTKFLQRIAAVISRRGHTIDELLRFMSKGDLPIADDGSIVAYKVLTTEHSNTKLDKGYYVDCHSRKVVQRIGSYVSQANVDPSRRVECSQGLHIARRGYLGGFGGNIIVLVKIAPEDVIAVPVGEPNKMRARGYHILSEIPQSEHSSLRSNRPMDGSEAKKLLAMALAGNHIDIIEDVIIGGSYGGDVKVIPRQAAISNSPMIGSDVVEAQPINHDELLEQNAPKVDPKAVSQKSLDQKMTNEEVQKQEEAVSAVTPAVEAVAETDEPNSKSGGGVVAHNVQRTMFNDKRYADLIALKKAKKQSWEKLGFSEAEVATITGSPSVPEKPKPVAKSPRARKAATKAAAEARKPKPNESKKAATNLRKPAEGEETNKQKARRLYTSHSWEELYALKKKIKTAWAAMGFTKEEEAEITRNAPSK